MAKYRFSASGSPLAAFRATLEEVSAADLILPGSDLDVVAYGCTSASMAIGEEKVFDKIRSVRPGARCTTPITAAFAAFRALGASRIGILTPYRADVNRIVAAYVAGLHAAGVPE